MRNFMKLGETCGLKIMEQQDGPTLDAGDPGPIPDEMSPTKLVEIYSKLWELQTASGLQIKKDKPAFPRSLIEVELEALFEAQRV